MNTLKIKNKSYKIRQTIRGIFLWEQITERSFEIKTTLDNYLYFYALILANNPDSTLTWEDFIDALDRDPSIIIKFGEILMDAQNMDKIFEGKEEDKGGKKKGSPSRKSTRR